MGRTRQLGCSRFFHHPHDWVTMAKSSQSALQKQPALKPVSETRKSAANPPVKKDKFALHVALATITLLAAFLAFYFYTHSPTNIDSNQKYMALPMLAIESDSEVVNLQVAIQVEDKDRSWLEDHKKTINEIFSTSAREIDPENFSSNNGREAVQKKLRDDLNSQLKVDRIKAVLYSGLVVQHKE